jgi:PPIC-type peptidyl-prolyl cis-trans isomerase-like protein
MTIRVRSFVLVAFAAAIGCSRDPGGDAKRDPVASDAPANALEPVPLYAPYPLGRWRLGDRGQLENVVLWTSHILIRFDGAKNDEVPFSLTSWAAVPPPPTRTRQAALELALDVARQARQNPSGFAELAARYSEDLPTKDRGGSLGGVTASQLTLWPQVVDALASLAPGEASEVVETWYGFHIFLRSPPPREQRVSGAQIVIGHDQAPWLAVLARTTPTRRTREEARALAFDVYEQARANPAAFAELVARYSEHRTAAQAGDFGSYSTREPSWYPRQVEVLGQLRASEVAPPIETAVGFEIIQRTPERPRRSVAMDSLWLAFEPDAPAEAPSSRASVRALAEGYVAEIVRDEGRFDSLWTTVCCGYTQQWIEGRGTPALTLALESLQDGQFAPAPVQSEFNYVIVRRREPALESAPPTLLELPSPDEVDLDYHVASLQAPFAEALLRGIGERAERELGLAPGALSAYRRAHELAGRIEEATPPDARQQVLHELVAAVDEVLDESQRATYRSVMRREFQAYLLDPAHETAIPRLPM